MTIENRPAVPHLPNLPAQQMRTLTGMTGSSAPYGSRASTADLARQLFTAPERWGWEYVEPVPPQPYPHLADYPRWAEPMGPDVGVHERALAAAKWKLGTRLKIAGGLFLLGLLVSAGSGALGTMLVFAAFGVAGFAAYQIWAAQEAIRQAQGKATAQRDSVHAMFLEAKGRWDERIAEHDAAERRRVATDPLLFPLAPGAAASRVDVVGGTSAGWAAMLATMGSSVLATGGTLLVLDLSRHDVTGPLCSLADGIRVPRQTASVPAALEAPWLLGDLEPRRFADVLATAIDSMRRRNDDISLAAMDAEIIRTVVTRIERPFTFARLLGGVRVLRRKYDPDEETSLTAGEVGRLTECIDSLSGEKIGDELRFVENQLDVLAADEAGTTADVGDVGALWRSRGLAVLRSDARPMHGLRSVVDRVAFAAVMHRLAHGQFEAPDATLVVVGADDLGRPALEEMAHSAYRARVRLVYVFKELRDDAEDVLGGAGSVAVLMRLGNGRQAQTAAEFVGHGFTFEVSQLSKQVGTTITNGTNQSTTTTTGYSETQGRSGSRSYGHGGGSSDGWNESVTESWSTASTHGTSWSEGRSENDGVTIQRSREFTVEPTQVQTLEETAFLLVDSGPQGRRVRMADCFPGTVLVPRRSDRPQLGDGRH